MQDFQENSDNIKITEDMGMHTDEPVGFEHFFNTSHRKVQLIHCKRGDWAIVRNFICAWIPLHMLFAWI